MTATFGRKIKLLLLDLKEEEKFNFDNLVISESKELVIKNQELIVDPALPP